MLTPAILQAFQVIETVLQLRPSRELHVLPRVLPRFVAASDAALEDPGQGTGGFLIVWLTGEVQMREAFVADIPATLYAYWTPGDKKIAQLELAMVLYVLCARPAQFRNRRGVWYIDNVAALMCLIRGAVTRQISRICRIASM